MMLEDLSFELVRALDGEEALEKLAQQLPDVVILDILLDKVMGNDVFRQMRQEPRYANVPVIVVSVLSADRCEDLMEMDNRTFFLRKPFRKENLLASVRNALANSPVEG